MTTVIFDTSGINSLLDDPSRQIILDRLAGEWRVNLTGTNVEEIVATKDSKRRTILLDLCSQLSELGECLVPFHKILEAMARCNSRYRERFRWRDVDVAFPKLTEELRQRQFILGDTLSNEQRLENKQLDKQFLRIIREARDHSPPNSGPPSSVSMHFLGQKSPGGPFWKHAVELYEMANIIPISEKDAAVFIGQCPPFHAAALASTVAQYQYAFPGNPTQPPYKAGRLDLLMATYLAYADFFVTHDERQRKALAAIVDEVRLGTKVVDYQEFRSALNPNP